MEHGGPAVAWVLGLALLLYCWVVLLTEASWQQPLVTLPADQVIQYVQKRQFEAVDVVLLPPFVMDGDKNLSVVSVLRFLPWFRRMHIHDPAYVPSRTPVEYWTTHQHAKVVFFHQPLLEYTLTTGFLAERFVVLQPLFVLSNYAFLWQFFIDESPVLRTCATTGLVPLTRPLFNENAYRTVPPASNEDAYAYAWRQGVTDRRVRYVDNRDHFVPPCAARTVSTVRAVGAVYDPAAVRAWLHFHETAKDRTSRPVPLVLAVMAQPRDDLTHPLPSRYAGHVQVWVHLTDLLDADARLAFTHRMIVSRNVFVEIYLPGLHYDAEKVGAEIMKQLKKLSQDTAFHVSEVFSHAPSGRGPQQPLANAVGNKLARTYSCPFAVFPEAEPRTDEREWQRLLQL